jgi:tetratricopeptide (TPR) repeat protein
LGTLRYMSPEQALAKRVVVDHRSDIYSLGVTLYELLTLQPAYKATDRQELLHQIAFDEPRKPRQINARIPQDLETIIIKAIEKNPADRYATSHDLADDLKRFVDDKPIVARAPSFAHRARKWAQRHVGLLVTTASVLLLTALGAGTAAVLIASANHQARLDKTSAILSAQQALAAAKAENLAKQAAQAREADLKAVLEFVENKVFAAARPEGEEGGLGRDVSLQRAIEVALPYVETSFADQPVIEARLRTTLGTSFRYLDHAEMAVEQEEKARALFTKHLGPDHTATLGSMNNLALSYRALGRRAEALQLHEATLARQKAQLGDDHPDTLASMNNLANCLDALGRHADALQLYEETLALRKAVLGPDDPHTLQSMRNLAKSYHAIGRHADALSLFEQTAALAQTELGPHHPDTLRSKLALAHSYNELGQYQRALNLSEETLAVLKTTFGADHPFTLWNMNNLANTYTALGRFAEAVDLHEQTLAVTRSAHGPDHPDTLASMNNLAYAYAQLGRHDDARKLFEETLALMESKLGSNHITTLGAMHNVANSYAALGRHDDALQLREETLARHKSALGQDHPYTLACMAHLASSYAQAGRHAEALQLDAQALALGEAKLAPDHPIVMATRNNLACHLAALPNSAPHDARRAVELAEKNIELAPDEGDYWNTLGVARYRAGDWNAAVTALEKSVELRHGGDSNDFFFLAMAHGQLGRKGEAHQWYNKAIEWMGENQPKNEELIRYCAEAAELLHITEAQPSANPQRAEDQPSSTNSSTDSTSNPNT